MWPRTCSIAESLKKALGGLKPTHVYITTWSRRATEAENIEVNSGMVRNLLAALAPARSVKHVALVTGLKHYLGPFDAYVRTGTLPLTPLREEQPRLETPNFYYAQEDEVYAAAKRDGFTWSVHRPHTIIGKAIGNAMNMGTTLAAYASICKELGRPFTFPGSAAQWNGLSDMTDTRILAKQLVWASTQDFAKNEAYNIVNGDIFRWSWMWPRIAKWFGVEWVRAGRDGPVGNADGEGRPGMEGNGGQVWSCRARPLARGLALAHGSRPEPADRSDDGHGAEPEAGLSCLPEHGGRIPRSVLGVARGQDHSLNVRRAHGSKEQARMEVPGKRADSTSAAAGHYRPPTGSGGSGRERPNTIRMTEHELLRIIAFLERVRQPFQDLIPIADEDATWNMLLFLIKSHLTGTPVTLSALASVANVPHATAMRRIHALIESGHIETETFSDAGKRFKLLPSDALTNSFVQYARRIKFLLAETFGLRSEER